MRSRFECALLKMHSEEDTQNVPLHHKLLGIVFAVMGEVETGEIVNNFKEPAMYMGENQNRGTPVLRVP